MKKPFPPMFNRMKKLSYIFETRDLETGTSTVGGCQAEMSSFHWEMTRVVELASRRVLICQTDRSRTPTEAAPMRTPRAMSDGGHSFEVT